MGTGFTLLHDLINVYLYLINLNISFTYEYKSDRFETSP